MNIYIIEDYYKGDTEYFITSANSEDEARTKFQNKYYSGTDPRVKFSGCSVEIRQIDTSEVISIVTVER